MYRKTVSRKNMWQVWLRVGLCGALSLTCLYLGGVVPYVPMIPQIMSVLFVVAVIYYLLRYVITTQEYFFGNDTLVITVRQGRKMAHQFKCTADQLLRLEKGGQFPIEGVISFRYSPSFGVIEYYTLHIRRPDNTFCLKIEPDDELVALLQNAIANKSTSTVQSDSQAPDTKISDIDESDMSISDDSIVYLDDDGIQEDE